MPIGALRTALLVRGVLAVLFGIVALVWPKVTILALALLFGAFALVDGVSSLMAAFRRHGDAWHRAGHALAGVIGVVAGVVTLLWPGITALVLVLMIAAWAVVSGVADVWTGFRLRDVIPAPWLMIVVGALSVVAGVILFARPGAGALAIAIVIGAYALVSGALMLLAAWRLSRFTGRTVNPAR
jgi:uncharacterized membrane protein HdeD (DUF308 family)